MKRQDPKKNIIVLLLDTMRASALAEPGLHNIGRFARRGAVYTNAVAPGTWSPPSHASLFTDKPVTQIKEVSKDFFAGGTKSIDPWMVKTRFLNDNTDTLARRIGALGYQTVCFSNNPFLTSFTNLGVGFSHIEDIWLDSNLKYNKGLVEKLSAIINGGASAREKMFQTSYYMTRMLPSSALNWMYLKLRRKLNDGVCKADGTYRLDRGAKDTEIAIKNYLDRRYDYRPQFMFMNYMEAHENYPVKETGVVQDKWMYLSGIEEMNDYIADKLYRAYVRRLKYLDGMVGRTLDILKGKGLLDNATVVITSDHGQFFGEHGLLYHAMKPYEEGAKVPLLAANYVNGKISGVAEKVDQTVSLRALNQSLVNLADGTFDYLDGNLRKDRYVISEHTGIAEGWDADFLQMLKSRSKAAAAIYDAKSRCNRKSTAVYKGNMKLIHNFDGSGDELYDVSKDPQEADNIVGSRRDVALELSRHLS